MFNLFPKKTSQASGYAASFVGFRRGRGLGGFSFHIINGENWTSICGVDLVERKSEVTLDSVRADLPMGHPGFHYCSQCVETFLK